MCNTRQQLTAGMLYSSTSYSMAVALCIPGIPRSPPPPSGHCPGQAQNILHSYSCWRRGVSFRHEFAPSLRGWCCCIIWDGSSRRYRKQVWYFPQLAFYSPCFWADHQGTHTSSFDRTCPSTKGVCLKSPCFVSNTCSFAICSTRVDHKTRKRRSTWTLPGLRCTSV